MASLTSRVSRLPEDIGSLSRGLPPARPDTLFVLGSNGGLSVAPDAEFPLLFGRNAPEVHICVGVGDTCVSRRHGLITREYSRWMLRNTGKLPIRFPGSRLVLSGDQTELSAGYTPLFIVAPRQEHLLEVRIAAQRYSGAGGAGETYGEKTFDGDKRDINPQEKLVLVCLAQRYLQGDPQPQPLTWAQVADELGELRRRESWSSKKAAHIVTKVRKRLSRKDGVYGLVEKEVPPPVGNALNHNLINDLLVTTTIAKSDLSMLEPAPHEDLKT
jgi:hypothetical protein